MYRSLIRTSLVRQLGSKVPSRKISRGYSSGFSRGFSIQNRMIAGFAGISAGLIGVGLIGSSFAIQNDVDQVKFDDEFKQALEETKKELEDVKKALEEAELAENKSDREEFDEEFKQAWGFAAKVLEDVLALVVNPDQESEETSYESTVHNPQTGEINWDSPGLGALTDDGPCSEEFREALSCFLYSGSDPKGIECARKFEFLNYCFEKYPEHYMEKWCGGVEPEGEFDTTTPAEENSEAPVNETAK